MRGNVVTGEYLVPTQPCAEDHTVTTPRDELATSAPEDVFKRVATLAALLFEVPAASVALVDTGRFHCATSPELEELFASDGVPLGAGTLLGDRPCAIVDIAADARAAGIVWARRSSVRCYAASPVIDDSGRVLGAVEVLDVRPRDFSEADLSLLGELAGIVLHEWRLRRSALTALRREREQREHMMEFATAFQRTLLPPSLPQVPGLQLASHYHAASPADVTGDFYDVFALGDGRWAFFLGDVAGHGVHAAAVTSLARYALRTAALHRADDPVAVLEELNNALLMDHHTQRFCTVLFGVLYPGSDGGFEVVLATGGHPPALLLGTGDSDSPVRAVRPAGGMLVGAFPDATFATTRLRLTSGQTLLIYTDGLIEARPGGEPFGEHGLLTFLRPYAGRDADEVISALTGLITSFTPRPKDDTALLALHVPADPSVR